MEIAIRIRVGNAAPQAVRVESGTLLVQTLRRVGLALDQPCGGRGVCGKCRVRITKIDPQTEKAAQIERAAQTGMAAQTGGTAETLACQFRVVEPVEVAIAVERLVDATGERIQTTFLPNPQKITTIPSPPEIATATCRRHERRPTDVSESTRLSTWDGVPEGVGDVGNVKDMGNVEGVEGDVSEAMIRNRTARTTTDKDARWGVAVDLGTTTLAARMVDRYTGERGAVTARRNPQTAFGADVISRIQYASEETASQTLQRLVVEAIDEMVENLCDQSNVSPERIAACVVAGNTTMQQLLMGRNVEPLGRYPFTPATYGTLQASAAELARRCGGRLRTIPERTIFETFPVISGFVGGDTVAGMVATRFMEGGTPAIFLDIGTNGEMVLRMPADSERASFSYSSKTNGMEDGVVSEGGRAYRADMATTGSGGVGIVTATAAGPAFEGAKIRCGTRAMAGAIQHCGLVDGVWRCDVIGGDVPVVGICGSALPDVVATLLEAGILAPDGRLLTKDRLPSNLPADLRDRVVQDGRHGAFVLMNAAQSADRTPIVLTQRDVREVQLASGAIRTGVELLLKRAGIEASELTEVVIAGGFGNVLNRDSMRRMGMFPATIPSERIRMVGNSSLEGAIDWIVEPELRGTIERITERLTAIDLSADPMFQRTFAESMRFPAN